MEKKNKLWQIFKSTLYLSAFTFGGGYVILTLMKDTFVDKLKWIDKDQMLDMTAIAQSAPGAVAINASIVVGYETGGLAGMFVAILGTAIPPLIIISVISMFYEVFIANKYIASFLKGMQAAIAALIFKVSYDMGKDLLKEKSIFIPVIMVIAFVIGYFLKVNIVYIIASLIVLGLINSFVKRRNHAN